MPTEKEFTSHCPLCTGREDDTRVSRLPSGRLLNHFISHFH